MGLKARIWASRGGGTEKKKEKKEEKKEKKKEKKKKNPPRGHPSGLNVSPRLSKN